MGVTVTPLVAAIQGSWPLSESRLMTTLTAARAALARVRVSLWLDEAATRQKKSGFMVNLVSVLNPAHVDSVPDLAKQ